ncbi:MAG TPA: hypothetical protein PLC98_17085 [Anaerolineales bacterium]|nr:hypothetical protein [Anaerolineales bacterium]
MDDERDRDVATIGGADMLRQIFERVVTIDARQSSMDNTLKSIAVELGRHGLTLYGDGSRENLGIMAEIQRVEDGSVSRDEALAKGAERVEERMRAEVKDARQTSEASVQAVRKEFGEFRAQAVVVGAVAMLVLPALVSWAVQTLLK